LKLVVWAKTKWSLIDDLLVEPYSVFYWFYMSSKTISKLRPLRYTSTWSTQIVAL